MREKGIYLINDIEEVGGVCGNDSAKSSTAMLSFCLENAFYTKM